MYVRIGSTYRRSEGAISERSYSVNVSATYKNTFKHLFPSISLSSDVVNKLECLCINLMKYGVCFIIKIFLAALAIVFLVATVSSIFLYIFRMAICTCNAIISCPSDFSQISTPLFIIKKCNKVDHRGIANRSALSVAETF
jgi:hypothetical protein